MVTSNSNTGKQIAQLIVQSGLTIHAPLSIDSPLFFSLLVLEDYLREALAGKDLNYPIRTRAKVAKSLVAEALGYPVPRSFPKNQPRFTGQNLDVYVQKADNLQIWNEEIDPIRRFVIIRVDANSSITDVRVVTGESLALMDRTKKLTKKFQASRRVGREGSLLVSQRDTPKLTQTLMPNTGVQISPMTSPITRPKIGEILTIAEIYARLTTLVGTRLPYGKLDQERNRGAQIHKLVCQVLGYTLYADNGQFPDIPNQLVEVKLQTSRTIDLGLITPDSAAPAAEVGENIRHCDIRYVIFYAIASGIYDITLSEVVVTTGEEFFREFQRFEGNVINGKLQIPLGSDFFSYTKGGPDDVI